MSLNIEMLERKQLLALKKANKRLVSLTQELLAEKEQNSYGYHNKTPD